MVFILNSLQQNSKHREILHRNTHRDSDLIGVVRFLGVWGGELGK